MSFPDFLLKGPSLEQGHYDYETYSDDYSGTPTYSFREKMASIWENFSIYTRFMISGGVAGITAGLIVISNAAIPPFWILGGVILIASIAFTILSGVRYFQAGLQQRLWEDDSIWRTHASVVAGRQML